MSLSLRLPVDAERRLVRTAEAPQMTGVPECEPERSVRWPSRSESEPPYAANLAGERRSSARTEPPGARLVGVRQLFTRQAVLPFALLYSGALPSADEPIVRRHDQPDSLYVQLGRGYSALAHINLPTPQGAADGEGTLIAPRWILTAAHVATEVEVGHRITVGGIHYPVDSVILHPDWNDGPHDIALLRLATPADGFRPARLYRERAELDRLVVLVGYGDFGTGLTGPEGNDERVRGATNRIDEATDFWLKFAFDPPGDARTTRLEGVSGPGDSGGPAFLHGDEGQILVGVSSGQSTRAAGGQPGRYGVVEYYVRVSRYVAWIESVTGPLPSHQDGPRGR